MSHCPNINSIAWKNLVDAIGEKEAWREFFKYGYIPNASNYGFMQTMKPEIVKAFESFYDNGFKERPDHKSWYVKDHLNVVKNIVNDLYAKYGGNKTILDLMVYTHDLAKAMNNESKSHRETIEPVLKKMGIANDVINTVISNVEMMDKVKKESIADLPIEVKILSTADALSHYTTGNRGFLNIFSTETSDADMDSIKESNEKKLAKDKRKILLPDFNLNDTVITYEGRNTNVSGSVTNYLKNIQDSTLKSIRIRSTEDIAAGINPDLIRTKDELKYTDHIASLVISEFGEITPNQVARVSMDKAFENTKAKFEKALRGMNDFINIVQNQENFNKLMSEKPEVMQGLIETFSLQGIESFDDVTKVKDRYQDIIENFAKYKDYAKADLLHRGIKEVKGKVELVSIEDVTNQEQNDTEETLLSQEEIGERYDKAANEINPLLTASLRVRALVQAVPIPGAYELGIPLYADPSDVFADLLDAGVAMQLTGYTTTKGKYDVFMESLQDMAQARPYLYTVINKLEAFKNKGEWDTINQMLTFVTKAFANETLVLYKTRKSGNQVMAVSEVKVVNLNRDTVEQQVSRDWYNSLLQSKFFVKDATGQRFPKPEKVEELNRIIQEGRALSGPEQVKKFQEFFKVMGITISDADMEYISPKLGNAIKKRRSFEIVFAKNGMLENIYSDYAKNLNNAFVSQYGLQNEKKNMNKLARLYYEANPGRYKLPSSKTADGKQKYLHVQPSFTELRKRDWALGNTSKVTNSALGRPNKQFWVDVRNNEKTFELNYFNGMREQQAGKDGKVRKNFTSSEQIRAMFMKHQENMNTGTYVIFTLSDKTTSIEAKMTKEFFVDGKIPVGKNQDFILVNGEVQYTPAFREKMYDSFVAPEISRILSAIASGEKVNIENYDVASKLFYIIPSINSNSFLENFRKDLYSGTKTEQELKALYGDLIGSVVTSEFSKSVEEDIDDYIKKGIIKNQNGVYSYPSFRDGYTGVEYLARFRATDAKGRNLARLMVMDMKTNYMNAQVKTIQFLRFDPALAFKSFKGFTKVPFSQITGKDKIKLAKSTWDEFSKRAAALIAPGAQGNWSWETSVEKGGKYFSSEYKAITAADYKVTVNETDNETTDAEEFVTMQEHIDFLMSEGKIPLKVWESITKKIKEAGPGGYYELSGEELKHTFTPVKPVHVNDVDEAGVESGLNRVDYVKSSRYPLIPEHEAGSERDKLRQWMEKNDIRSLNFASGKKLGRPGESVTLFDKAGNFVEPDKASTDAATQILSRDGLRTQQEIPHQKEEIATVSQMNRTILDGLLEETFTFAELGDLKGRELKDVKEKIRSRLFDIKAAELENELGNLSMSHVGIHNLLKKVILEDTTGTYGENDLRLIELNEEGKFKYPLEMNFKFEKIQGLINSMINRNVMLKMNGTSFVQVSGVGSKFTFSSLSDKVKSGIIWTSDYAKQFKEGDVASLSYIKKEGNEVKPAQVIVSQYIKDEEGNLIDLTEFITEKNGMKILDTSKINKSLLQLVASRIPNQSLTSTLPIEVVGFLPSYMENTIVVPDGITGQMGSDFDVDKLYAYTSTPKEIYKGNKLVKLDTVRYKLTSLSDIDNMSEEELKEAYKDLHWTVLTSPAAFGSITKSVDMPEVKTKVKMREDMLNRYEIGMDDKTNLPLDFNTSITRFSDNKSGKDGVSIFANLISAQADFQNKILRLGYKDEKGNEKTDPVKIKLTKNGKVIDLLYIGKLGQSTSFVNKNVKRSISDNLNMMFTEAVDNAKNQFLREFNWTEKSMSAVGALQMLTSEDGQTPPIEFSMDLTSQRAIVKLFDLIDQKQDSFNDFDSNAFLRSVSEILDDLIKRIDEGNYLKNGQTAQNYLIDDNRDDTLDPETLSEMWLIGNILQDGSAIMNAKAYQQAKQSLDGKEEDVQVYDPITHSYITEKSDSQDVFEGSVVEPKLIKAMKEFGYKSIDEMLLSYYTTQFDAILLFSRLNDIGKELMTILGSVYTYTKGIGPDVFTTKQKLNQLSALANSGTFLGIENVAGEVFKSETGRVSIMPVGEIGTSIEKSLIVAQDIYNEIFPISTGMFVEDIAQSIMGDKGWTKESLGKQTFLNLYNDVFDAVKSYLFTNQNLELFLNAKAIRASLINGDTSLGATITKLKEIPEFSKNGFLKNLEVKQEYGTDVYTISFKAPLGAEMDEKSILSGFYELATSDNEVVRETARNLALYPFATGDAGLLGRFIPVDYYMGDEDFKKAISNLEGIFSSDMIIGGISTIKDQIVQNNPETYAKNFNFVTTTADNTFKRNFKKRIGNADSLEKVKNFTIALGDFEADPKAQGIIDSLQVDLTLSESMLAPKGISTNKKYPPYIMITDTVISDNPGEDRSNKYLYKRTSPAVTEDGIATYERINILGFRNIKEFSFAEPNLKSAIPGNMVDVSDQEFKEVGTDQSTPDDVPPVEAKATIAMQEFNIEKIKAGTKTTTTRSDREFNKIGIPVGQSATVNFGGQDFTVTNRGLLTIEEAGGKEAMLKSEGYATIDDLLYQQTKDWMNGKGKLYVYDITPTQTSVTSIKEASTKLNKVIEGDIFSLPGIPVITTNLGGVHGAGLAQLAKAKGLIKQGDGQFKATNEVVQLPVKKVWSDSMAMNDNMELLKQSLRSLIQVARENPSNNYLLPLAGLGHGEGSVSEIMPLLTATVNASPNISLVLPAENINLGRQGTVRKDSTREKMPAIKEELAKAGLIGSPAEEISTEDSPEEESVKTNTVQYGAHTFILEGNEIDGFQMWYQKQGNKGAPVTDPGVMKKVLLKHLVELHPENVVVIANLPRSPKYYIGFDGTIQSLQESSYGDEMTSDDIKRRVNEVLAQKLEHDTEVEDFTRDVLEKDKDAQTGKKINVPEGSNPNNMKIFEDENTIYLMNDGQQRAYNFIRSQVTKLLESSPYITEDNLTQTLNNTAAFLDPLSQKFNGIIPKVMWDNMIGLAGRGGVGKTTVIKAIMDSIKGSNKYASPYIMYLTPSHTAATVLQESLGLDSEKANDGTVNTIQSHVRRNKRVPGKEDLELASEADYNESCKFRPRVTSPDIIIVDESSMIKAEDIKDILTRLQTDVIKVGVVKMPVFIFMGDYRQLGPMNEEQNPMVNKGIISSTLFQNSEKTVELTQVMRSGDKELHEVFDSVGNQIIENMRLTQQGQQPKTLSFDAYDRLTSRSTPNMLVVNNQMGVVDDYTTFLMENNNPYGMFWVHYNKVDNPKTKNIAAKIRSMYFQKAGYVIDDEKLEHRKFSKGDYVEFTGPYEIDTADRVYYSPTSEAIKKLLVERKTRMRNGMYAIEQGVIKPRSRFKVLDITMNQESVKDIIPTEIAKFIQGDPLINIERFLLYNRQNKIRILEKPLGLQVQLGRYNPATRQQEGITIKNKFTGDVYAKFDLFYGEFKAMKNDLTRLNAEEVMPFVPSYIGSSHTAQGNSIKNVIVGEYNVKENRANPDINQDDIFSSLYVSLTRTSGRLIIIKPMGAPIANNQEVFEGAITDDNHSQKLVNSVKKASVIPEVPLASDTQIVNNNGNEKIDIFSLLNQSEQKIVLDDMMRNLFQGQNIITDYRGFMNRFVKQKTLIPFNKVFLDALAKMKVMTPFTIVIDENQKEPGTYNTATKTITINPKEALNASMDVNESERAIQEVIMHELLHHLTADMLQANPDTLTEEQKKFVNGITDLFIKVQQQMLNDPNHKEGLLRAIQQVNSDSLMSASDKSLYYGLTNVFDFVSMVMTDANFQEFMNNTKVEGEQSIFTQFINFLTDFLFKQLGIKVKNDSVLKEGIKNIVGLVKSRNQFDENAQVLKSARVEKAAVENIEKNFNDIIKFLNIKTKC